MRLIVGYLATPSGDDGLALGVQLAQSLGASLDICLVLPPEQPVAAKAPADISYESILHKQAQQWLAEAELTVDHKILVRTHIRYDDSFAAGLLAAAEEFCADMIVVGAAHDGLLGRHSIGSISNELLHCASVSLALAPKGFRHGSAPTLREVTCAVGSQSGSEALLGTAYTLCKLSLAPLRLLSLVSLDRKIGETTSDLAERKENVATAQRQLELAQQSLPQEVSVTVLVADGSSIEDAVSSLEWHSGDIVVVGSSRLASPRRVFLGSTASKMLRVLPVPMIVVPSANLSPTTAND
ncbi:MAG: universal stress protein [Mycobacteriaceae bacterium]